MTSIKKNEAIFFFNRTFVLIRWNEIQALFHYFKKGQNVKIQDRTKSSRRQIEREPYKTLITAQGTYFQ